MINFLCYKIKKIYQIKNYNFEFYKTKQYRIYKKNKLSGLLGIKKLIKLLDCLSIRPKRTPDNFISYISFQA